MLSRRQTLSLFAAVPAALTFAGAASAQEPEVYAVDGIAIKGADPVAYFTQEAAVTGSSEFSFTWRGAEWHFASAENRDLFAADPEAYAPQYGGYCAYALAQNALAPIHVDSWTIHKGKLYLNFNLPTQTLWRLNRGRYIEKVDANWPSVLG